MGYHDTQGRFRRTEKTFIALDLRAFHLAAGTALAAFADGASPTPGLALDDSEAGGIRWNNHATPAAIWGSFNLPADRRPDTDLRIHVKAAKTGATVGDATTFTIAAFFQSVGALRSADANAGGATGALTGNATSGTVQSVSRAIAAADVPDPSATDPCASCSLSIKPTDGTLGTDDVTIYQVLVEYERQDLAE